MEIRTDTAKHSAPLHGSLSSDLPSISAISRAAFLLRDSSNNVIFKVIGGSRGKVYVEDSVQQNQTATLSGNDSEFAVRSAQDTGSKAQVQIDENGDVDLAGKVVDP